MKRTMMMITFVNTAKGNMPQTKPKRTLSENFISFDRRFLVAIIELVDLYAQFERHQATTFYVARFERT